MDLNFEEYKVKYIENSLLLYLKFEDDSEYLHFVDTYINGLQKDSDKIIIGLINSLNLKSIDEYYTNILGLNSLKIINADVDFRGPYYCVNDGTFKITLIADLFRSKNIETNNFVFDCSDEFYNNIINNELSRIIFIVTLCDEVKPIVLVVSEAIKFHYINNLFSTEKYVSKVPNILMDSESSICSNNTINTYTVNLPSHETNVKPGSIDSKPGFVYIAKNKYITVLKIGRSSDVETRIKQLSYATSVPYDFELVYKKKFTDSVYAENLVHILLNDKRVSNKEFFNVSIEEAIAIIDKIDESKIDSLNRRYLK